MEIKEKCWKKYLLDGRKMRSSSSSSGSSSRREREREITSILSVVSYSPLSSTSFQRGGKETLDCDST